MSGDNNVSCSSRLVDFCDKKMCCASYATDSRARARCLMRQLIASHFSADKRQLHSANGHTALLFGLNVNLSSSSARRLIRLLAVHAGRTQKADREAYII